jgi:hypothetical protein
MIAFRIGRKRNRFESSHYGGKSERRKSRSYSRSASPLQDGEEEMMSSSEVCQMTIDEAQVSNTDATNEIIVVFDALSLCVYLLPRRHASPSCLKDL